MGTPLKQIIRDQRRKREEKKLKNINLLEEAQNDINNAIHKIRKALKDTSRERYCEVYLIGHLDNWANSVHSGGDTTIPVLMEEFYNEELE